MTRKAFRVALVRDLQWPYKRHTGNFAGGFARFQTQES
jgi:hypothetical protein